MRSSPNPFSPTKQNREDYNVESNQINNNEMNTRNEQNQLKSLALPGLVSDQAELADVRPFQVCTDRTAARGDR